VTRTGELILIAVGGAIGSVTRRLLGLWAKSFDPAEAYPWGTLGVNLLGCLAIGLIDAWLAGRDDRSEWPRSLLIVGLLGGFTTFSAFGLETVQLIKSGRLAVAGSYVAFSMLGGLAAVWIGANLASTSRP
jgi:CrcB protein